MDRTAEIDKIIRDDLFQDGRPIDGTIEMVSAFDPYNEWTTYRATFSIQGTEYVSVFRDVDGKLYLVAP